MEKKVARQVRYTVPGAVVLLLTAVAVTAFAQGRSLPVATEARTFLTPLASRFVIYPGEAGYPRGICPSGPVDRCPAVLAFGNGELPTIDPAFKADLPNVRVTFTLEKVSNVTPHTSSIDYADELRWKTWAVADDQVAEATLPVNMVTPEGTTWTLPNEVIIYDALLLGACASFTAFPLTHSASVFINGNNAGFWEGSDDSTIDHLGFYTFEYVTADPVPYPEGPHFRLFGKVSVTCTGLNSLP